jgi:ATP-dependent exoDNAse (exonuclease V) beta subunit
LQRLYAEPNPIPPEQPCVELLTIHAAKGLEWDVVLVPALERSPNISRGRLLTWAELTPSSPSGHDSDSEMETPAAIMLAPIAAKGEEIDALTRWLKELAKEREAAERKRLVYVAATRAREELHLFAAPDVSMYGNIAVRWDSLLKSAWPAAETHIPAKTGGAISPERTNSANAGPEPIVLEELAAVAAVIPFNQGSGDGTATDIPRALPETAPQASQPIMQRLPLSFDPAARFHAARSQRFTYAEHDGAPSPVEFARPEGSLAARSLGNVVHGFLELLTARMAAGASAASLLAEIPSWGPRITAVLRADGLDPATVARLARETRAALENTLRDRDGLWLLAPHSGAAAELALTVSTTRIETIRVDRIFFAGPEPHTPARSPEEAALWVVDYKTADHGHTGLDEFLVKQRTTYAPQLETYARILALAQSMPASHMRLALYYPTIPRLIWWKPSST